jgi:hypothetical protein
MCPASFWPETLLTAAGPPGECQARAHWPTRAFGECRAAQNGRYVRLIVEREGALGAFASVPERDIRERP